MVRVAELPSLVSSPVVIVSSYPFPSRLVVGAPQEVKAANQTGGLYHCDYSTGRCEAIPLQGESSLPRPGPGLGLHLCTHLDLSGLCPGVCGGGLRGAALRPLSCMQSLSGSPLLVPFYDLRASLDLSDLRICQVEVTPVQLLFSH